MKAMLATVWKRSLMRAMLHLPKPWLAWLAALVFVNLAGGLYYFGSLALLFYRLRTVHHPNPSRSRFADKRGAGPRYIPRWRQSRGGSRAPAPRTLRIHSGDKMLRFRTP